jgi:hypothetical protein
MKKTVAVIGAAGSMGTAFAFGLASAGHRVLLSDDVNRHVLRYLQLPILEWRIRSEVPGADVDTVLSWGEAGWEADVIVIVVPDVIPAMVARRIKDVVTGKIIVRLTHQPEAGRHGNAAPAGQARELAHLLVHSKVVTASPAPFAAAHGSPKGAANGLDVVVAGDDAGAVVTAMDLIQDAGLHPVAGSKLRDSQAKRLLRPESHLPPKRGVGAGNGDRR